VNPAATAAVPIFYLAHLNLRLRRRWRTRLRLAFNEWRALGETRKEHFVATQVTARNAPAVTASINSEPELSSVGWRRKGRRFFTSEKLLVEAAKRQLPVRWGLYVLHVVCVFSHKTAKKQRSDLGTSIGWLRLARARVRVAWEQSRKSRFA
jgi:hypothetical protein